MALLRASRPDWVLLTDSIAEYAEEWLTSAQALGLAERRTGELTSRLTARQVADLVLLGDETAVRSRASELALDIRDVQVIDPLTSDLLEPFADALRSGEPLCGRLHPDKQALLYGARAQEVESSALLSLEGTGLVAVGSADPNRFYPGMGTLFLRMMGEAFEVALRRFDG